MILDRVMIKGEVYFVEGDDARWIVVEVEGVDVVVARVFGYCRDSFATETWKQCCNGSERYLRSCPDGLFRDFVPQKIYEPTPCAVPKP